MQHHEAEHGQAGCVVPAHHLPYGGGKPEHIIAPHGLVRVAVKDEVGAGVRVWGSVTSGSG